MLPLTNTEPAALWPLVISATAPESLLHTAMRHVAHNLGNMVNRPIQVSSLRVETVPINRLAATTADPEAETVAIYLLLGEDFSGEAVLMLSPENARYLADWLLENRPGATARLGDLERSALAEFGNITLSSFLNTLADIIGLPLRLSPPTVIVDMEAVIFEAIALAAATVSDELLIIKTEFTSAENFLDIQFWVLPDVLTAQGEPTRC